MDPNLSQVINEIRGQFEALADNITTLGGIVLGRTHARGVARVNNTLVHNSRIRAAQQAHAATPGQPGKRTLTPGGRKNISAAQKKRWAVLKGGAKTATTHPKTKAA
jgi:hypothetical protein